MKQLKNSFQKRQQLKLFGTFLISFILLFLVLGAIVGFLFQHSIYQNVNQSLQIQKEQILGKGTPNRHPLKPQQRQKNGQQRPPISGAPFQTNIIVFNAAGKVLNRDVLGARNYQLFNQVKLNKNQLNQVTNLDFNTNQRTASRFRTLLLKVSAKSSQRQYAGHYVLILINTDAEALAIHSIFRSLLITMIIFTLLATLLAFWLSRIGMRPIITAWHKQQEFSANAAHELRTPLAIIQNQLEYLLTKPHQPILAEAEKITISLNETSRMKALTEQLLTLARSDADVLQLRPSQVDLKTLSEQVTTPYLEIAASQHKSLRLETQATALITVDPDLIKQLIIILLDNAVKYTPAGGTIVFTTLVSTDHWGIKVSDTGCGIPDNSKKQIFDRFYRVDSARQKEQIGYGLGLSIANWITTQHRGKINVLDNHPQGSIFRLTFPRHVHYR
ncbi:sensor histidine kinase [Loigolactobacillus iwatensis]|uniref:sensor histidine kinase n=1 Tax=Loigolactobacillus iwatensis TaxID=1267156 RepID=UPI000F7F84E2|nr:HAMP domain-containing sensor histidine kinase [Loigolactobacillus iwatensis]